MSRPISIGPTLKDHEVAEVFNGLTREEVELLAAAALRAIAKESSRLHSNTVTAIREAGQMTLLAIRLESFAKGAPE